MITPDIVWLFILLAAALVLFSLEWIPADVVAMGLLLVLTIAKLVPPERAFAGFSSDAVMMILGLLIQTAALIRTGIVDSVGRTLLRYTGDDPQRILLAIMIMVALLSAFISNTAATAFCLPIAFGISSRTGQSASKLLMPLAFASILTSSCTLISTSTNIVISEILTQYSYRGERLPPMGMFELAPVGIPVAVAGLAYMWFVGRRLIPDRAADQEELERFGLLPYLTEVMVLPSSPLVGKSLAEAELGRNLDLTVVKIVRDKDTYLAPRANSILAAGDVLIVEGLTENILKVKDEAGIDIKADVKLSDPSLTAKDVALVEAILLPRSPLLGRSLKSYRFRDRYGLQVLALKRRGSTSLRKLSQIQLRLGDVLLLQGDRNSLKALEESGDLCVLGAVDATRPNLRHAPVAIAIFVLTLAAATFKVLSLPVAALVGAFLVILTRCISSEEAYRSVEWKTLVVVGSVLGLGQAMEQTGAGQLLASWIIHLTGNAGPIWLLTGFFVLTVLLTQPMSNQAAAVVILPVAMQTAMQLDLNPRTFAMMIAVAASCSYLTPLEPSCLMVYGPGRYRFVDFLKVGGLLTVIIYILSILLVPVFWPLRP